MSVSQAQSATGLSQEVQLLFDLVSMQSVSGNERGASEIFVHHASALGFETEIDVMNNALAHIGADASDATTHIILLGHIDTVPGDIPVRIENGILHGRGSVDAKGPLCSMLMAASRAAIPEGVRVSVIGAVGEEAAESVGARHIVQQFQPDACIIGEPSSWDGVTLGYKGRLIARATCTRTNMHSAGPELSACDEVIAWWAQVLAFTNGFNEGKSRAFDQIQSTMLHMSSTTDGLDQSAAIDAGFRLPVDITPSELNDKLQSFTNELVKVEVRGHELAHATDRNDPVVRALSTSIRANGGIPRPKLKTGTADLNVVAPIWKCPIAAYGPGDSALDHTPIEHQHLDEYARSIEVLIGAVESLAAEIVTTKISRTNPNLTSPVGFF